MTCDHARRTVRHAPVSLDCIERAVKQLGREKEQLVALQHYLPVECPGFSRVLCSVCPGCVLPSRRIQGILCVLSHCVSFSASPDFTNPHNVSCRARVPHFSLVPASPYPFLARSDAQDANIVLHSIEEPGPFRLRWKCFLRIDYCYYTIQCVCQMSTCCILWYDIGSYSCNRDKKKFYVCG